MNCSDSVQTQSLFEENIQRLFEIRRTVIKNISEYTCAQIHSDINFTRT